MAGSANDFAGVRLGQRYFDSRLIYGTLFDPHTFPSIGYT